MKDMSTYVYVLTKADERRCLFQLTMEEKARLSREQEMHQRYKSQGATQLEPSIASRSSVTKSSVRDLSSSLLNTAVQLPSAPGSSAVGSASGVCWASTHAAGVTSQSWNGQPQAAKSSRTVDMSALDDIVPLGSRTRPTLNSMVQPSPASGPNPFGTPQPVMAPTRGPAPAGFGQVSMMMPGLSTTQMGIPSSFGGGIRPGNSAMGNIPALTAQQPGIPQSSQQLSTTNTTTSLSNKDIADLLG